MNSIIILVFLIAAPCLIASRRFNKECDITWPNRTEYYIYRDKIAQPVPLPRNSLRNKYLFNGRHQSFCRKLNQTLAFGYPKYLDETYSEYDTTYESEPPTYRFPVNFNDVDPVFGDGIALVTKKFQFVYTLLDGKRDPLIEITTKVPRDVCIRELTEGGKMNQIFPVHYKVTKYTSEHRDEKYYLIEGERCKGRYDQRSRRFVDKVCWKHPNFCRGRRFDCLVNDDKNTFCYDTETEEGHKKSDKLGIPYSMYIGETIYWKVPRLIYGEPLSDPRDGHRGLWTFTWNCTDIRETVLCEYLEDGPRPSLTALKTLSGYAG